MNREQKNTEIKTIFSLALALLAIIFFSSTALASQTSLIYNNNTEVSELLFDRMNGTTGSDAFIDATTINPNILLRYCHENISLGDRIDIRYFSESNNIQSSILYYPPQITSIDNSTDCGVASVSLASLRAVYPGFVGLTRLDETNASFSRVNTFLNGSYEIQISVNPLTRDYLISVGEIFDHNLLPITSMREQLILSLVSANNQSLVEGQRVPNQPIMHNGSLLGGERVFVNGIPSLEIRVIDPCSSINESGYYILNSSAWDVNQSCLTVENQTGVTVNFGAEIIDGDNSPTGSKDPVTQPCAVTIKNSQNITIESLRTQEFYYGICIDNSTVTVIDDTSVINEFGALVTNNARAFLFDISFDNDQGDVLAINNSRVTLNRVNFSSASITGTFKDLLMNSVRVPPPGPPAPGLEDIGQWIQTLPNSPTSYLELGFVYNESLPNLVVLDNVSIYKYNGTFSIPANVTNITNTTSPQWNNGVWTQLFTLVSPSERLIFSQNITSFSVYAPFAEPTNQTEPEPTPSPSPSPAPQTGAGGGGGGTPAQVTESEAPVLPEAINLELEIPQNITLQQGEAGDVTFIVRNIGPVTAPNLTISPNPPNNWDFTNHDVGNLSPGSEYTDTFQIASFDTEAPGTYRVVVSAIVDIRGNESVVASEVMDVIITPRSVLNRIRITEFPPVITIEPNSRQDVSFRAENIGNQPIRGIRVELASSGTCLRENVIGEYDLDTFENKVLTYTFQTNRQEQACNYNIRFLSEDDVLVGFVPMRVIVESRPLFDSTAALKRAILLLIFVLWSALCAYILVRRKK